MLSLMVTLSPLAAIALQRRYPAKPKINAWL